MSDAELQWAQKRIKSLNQVIESERPEYLMDLDDKVTALETKLLEITEILNNELTPNTFKLDNIRSIIEE